MSPPTPEPRATLLLFTLGANLETERRRLLPSTFRAEELALHKACLDNALAAGRRADCRLVVSSPADLELAPDTELIEQPSGTFGQRLGHAMAQAFSQPGPVIVVGGDSPELSAHHVVAAIARLEETTTDVVLGPCHDGGIYLLAARRPLGELLESVKWCRSSTLVDLVSQLRKAGLRVDLLSPLEDLDRPADLERWLAGPKAHALGTILLDSLLAALAVHRRPSVVLVDHVESAFARSRRWGRAPPRAA